MARPKFKTVALVLSIDDVDRLERRAIDGGQSPADLCEALVVAALATLDAPSAEAAPEAAPLPPARDFVAPPAGRPEPLASVCTDEQAAAAVRLSKMGFTTPDVARLMRVSEAAVAKALKP